MRRWASILGAGALAWASTGVAVSAVWPGAPSAGAQTNAPMPAATAEVSVASDRAPVVGDFDGDGRTDLLWYSGVPGADAVWFGGADRSHRSLPLNVGAGFAPFAGDFNGDGADDVVWYRPAAASATIVWYGARDGSFVGAGGPVAPPNARPIVADLDGNGSDDVFFYNPTGDDALFYATSGGFRTTAAAVGGAFTTATGDFDGDGAHDVAWYDRATGEGVLWWGGPTLVGTALRPGGGFDLRAGDFNGDGVSDLFWFHPGPGGSPAAVWYGQRSRAFVGAGVPGGGAFQLVVGDFDGNGASDVLFVVPSSGPNYTWLFGGGSFTPYVAPAGVSGEPVVGDFDGDGSDDVLFARPGPATDTFWYGPRLASSAAPALTVSQLVTGLANPWDLAFTPDGTMLFTERAGRLSARRPDGTVRSLTADLSDLFVASETGLMGIVVDPRFASNRRFYTCQGATGPQVKVVAWQVDSGYTTATRVIDPVLGGLPSTSGRHGGCRLRFDYGGALLVSTGDAATGTNPEDLTSLGGKTLRVDPSTGAGLPGNPFFASPNANTRRLLTYGHRNVQGLAIRAATGQVYSVEHGPDRDDEVNILVPGADYGWNPVPGYNEGVPMTRAGATPSVWSSGAPTVAPSGAAFLEDPRWGAWTGALAVATLKGQALRVQTYTTGGALVSEVLPAALNGTYGRLRAAVLGPDGALYLSTDNGAGDSILRVAPS